ncbi:cytochrome P450 [Dendrothele bispora CBS 962.96]|uniref:Cytochrome P450 n=1 Tax=Dendrothele bispora (strain CBS 962.96) TaxID=1314807 RepID=A0A4S8MY39_DENBC|nr:cytochrome P450 [Dendrothele bispora CBS 962.96]
MSLLTTLGGLLLSIQLVVLLFKYIQRRRWDVNKLPSPSSKHASWIWGHELAIFKHEACEMYGSWAALLGSVYRVQAAMFQPDIVVVADNAAASHIFQNPYNYVKAPAFLPIVDKLLGRGIVWAEGDEHKHQRRLLAPAFTINAVKGMADDIFECADKLAGRLRARVSQGGNIQSVLNIVPYTSSCTLDMVGRIAFGHDFGAGESVEAKEIGASWHQDVMLGHSFGGFLAPIIINFLPWIPRLPVKALQTDGVAKQIAKRLAGRILDENRVGSHSQGRDILSLLMEDNRKKATGEAKLTDEQLLDNVSTFIMVGHETTAATVNFTLLQLSRNPEAQRKLRAELNSTKEALDYDSINKLTYLDAVAREGLRLHPAAPRTERVAVRDDVIPLSAPIKTPGGETLTSLPVKAGQVFHIPFTVLNTNYRVWGRDAHMFKPERWLEADGVPQQSELPRGPWVGVSTFCDGPRSCIGWRLGLIELKVLIATLVRNFEFQSTDADIKQFISPTLQPFVGDEGGVMPMRLSLVPEL